jgi:hypothetical protein
MNIPKTPAAENYREALLALESSMTETRRKLLTVHYHFPNRRATMTQISNAMGWVNYSSGNIHYGNLAKLIGDQLGFHFGTVHLNSICEFNEGKERKDSWILTLRPELAEAMESVGWT